MGVLLGARVAERIVERELPSGGVEEVRAPHDLRDTHEGIVHHDGELVRHDAIAAPRDEIARDRGHILGPGARNGICDCHRHIRRAEAKRRLAPVCFTLAPLALGQRAARAGIPWWHIARVWRASEVE